MPKSTKQVIKSPLRYPGGKQKAIVHITEMLPPSALEYREPMVGGGSVFLHAKQAGLASRYWINDILKELMSFWLIAQDQSKCTRMINELEKLRQSFKSADEVKDYFLKIRRIKTDDRFEQALNFFFFNRITFSGTTQAGGFSKTAALTRFTSSSIERLRPLTDLLLEAKITDIDYEQLVSEPGEDVFLFLDPPHYHTAKIYGRGGEYNKFEHDKLASLLKRTKHKFLITADDCSEIRQLYSWANQKEWSIKYGMTNCNTEHSTKTGSELFVYNY